MSTIQIIPNHNERLVDLHYNQLEQLFTGIVQREFKAFTDLIQPPAQKTEYLTRKQAAEKFHVTLPTLRDWTKSGKVRSHQIGRRVLYRSEELDLALRVQRKDIRK